MPKDDKNEFFKALNIDSFASESMCDNLIIRDLEWNY